MDATSNNELKAADLLAVAVAEATISVGNTAVALRAGGSNLVNRKSIQIQAQGTNVVYGYNITTQRFTIANGSSITLALGPGITVYAKRSSGIGNVDVMVAEFS